MKKPEIRRLTLEGVLIVFSVLFALFISQMVENNKVKQQKKQAINYIFQELSGNKLTAERWLTKHRAIQTNLNRMIADPQDSLRQLLFSGDQLDYGVITNQEALIDALLGDTAWEAAKSTQIISEFDFGLVQEFTRIYGLQKILMESSVGKFTDIYFDRASQDATNLQLTLVQLHLVISEMVSQEETLLYMLKGVLDRDWKPEN